MKSFYFIWRLIQFRPRSYLYNMIAFTVLMLGALAPGWVFREFFTLIALDEPARFGIWTLLVMLLVGTVARMWGLYGMLDANIPYAYANYTLLHKNLLTRLFQLPGAAALPESPGAAITRLRDDVDELPWFTLWFNNLVGYVAFMIVAVAIMISINLTLTLVAFLPLAVIVTLASVATERLERYRKAAREASGSVTDFIAEIFGSVLAVKLGRAEDQVVNRMVELNDERRKTSLMDRLLEEALHSVYHHTGNLGTGIILLLAVPAFRAQSFTVGDFALFVSYLSSMTAFFSFAGFMWARYRQVGVSINRLQELMQDANPDDLVRHGPVYLAPTRKPFLTLSENGESSHVSGTSLESELSSNGAFPEIPFPERTEHDHLQTLNAKGLSYRFPESTNGIFDIDLTISHGSFTMITGRIGSGKTTLLRCLLGLLPLDAGTVTWNHEPISSPADFFVPPRCAYTAQVPRLFSTTLRENLLLGLDEERIDLDQVIHHAVLEQDITDLEQGLETVIGPKGVKLSGGQVQRASAARMFVRQPELLVFDDLSSALDVNTERVLWERLFALNSNDAHRTTPTCLVVSHRRPALRRADQIVVLKDGRVEDIGKVDELLVRCEEMQRLWEGDGSRSP
ncbi:ABC transporter ATP-binding protein/permease [Chloroflexi bacterium TSY]|nr:ABC transporter ATP-binding protein/permease [Chloroflexi bacterium TSY]